MNVILRKDIKGLGNAGEVKKVKEGYARNYLIPQDLVYMATPKNMKRLEEDKKFDVSKKKKERKKAEDFKVKLESLSCTITRKGEQDNKIFGSVTSGDISKAIAEKGIEIDKKKIEITEPIKEFGIYTVSIDVYPDIAANMKIWVVKE